MKLLKIEAYKQSTEKKVYLSPIQLLHVYGPIAHGVLQGEPKSEWSNTSFALAPIATQPSAVYVSLASPSAVAYVGHRPAHILALSHPGWKKRGFYKVGQKFEKNFEFLTISSLYVRYISATAKNRRLQAAYVAFYPSCRNPVKSVHRGKASRLAKGFLQGGPKNSKKIRIFDH